MDSFTLKNYFISKGFLLVEVRESYEINDNTADIHFKIDEGKQFFISKVQISGICNLSYSSCIVVLFIMIMLLYK